MSQSILDPRQITQPDPVLMRYYFFCSLCAGPLMPVVLLQFWMRYTTLRYRFDDEGVSMSWGVLFRREINLTYRRIQDIHLTANPLQRWMDLAKISIQTASGNASAEMTIEGIRNVDALRDFLYAKMRGAKSDRGLLSAPIASANGNNIPPSNGEAVAILNEIRDALRVLVERKESSL